MEIQLDSSKLLDNPYSSDTKDLFIFDETQVDDFCNDLIFGNPTCYLVSGYRGVGKTSLVKKVQDCVAEKLSKISTSDETVFVYTSFARSESRMHIIRKLIRELYLEVEKTEKFKDLGKTEDNGLERKEGKDNDLKKKNKALGSIDGKKFAIEFSLLYQQTFKEVSQTSQRNFNREYTITSEFSLAELIESVCKQLAPLLLLIPWYVSVAFKRNFGWLIEWLFPVISIAWVVVNTIKTKVSFMARQQYVDGLYTKTLFDDEIAGTLFLSVLKQLEQLQFKIVFVFDELDKVDLKDLDSLINEMKPYLVCGYAKFIVIGGQNLYYKYKQDDSIDDSVLSSLFARVYHVSIASPAILRDLFYEKMVVAESLVKLNDEERKELDAQLNYIIFKSRLIPRRFITKLRQVVIWRGKQTFLISNPLYSNSDRVRKIIDVIDKVDEHEVEIENPAAIRDYIIMQMYLHCDFLYENKGAITKKGFVNGRSV
jgi:hypothetical protein